MFQLLRFFSVTSLILLVVATIILGALYRQIATKNLLELGESNNIVLTQTFANFIWPQFRSFAASSAQFDDDTLRTHPEIAKLHQSVLDAMHNTQTVKVKLYQLDGRTLFSSEISQIGSSYREKPGFIAASKGLVVSELSRRDKFSAFHGKIVNRDLLASYVPVRSSDTAPIEGVLEVYTDVTDLVASIKKQAIMVTATVAGVLATLYIILFFIVRHADRIIKRQYEQIRHQATYDGLTGLPNRILFHEMLAHAMARTRRTEKLLAVMFIDLDGFKNINDTLGHKYGDILLKEIALRLTAALRKDDLVARQGGDEFIILVQDLAVVQSIVHIAEKILAAVSETVIADGHAMHVTASIGITVFPFDDVEIDHLLRDADIAMYHAKEAGKNNFRFYAAEMNALIRERLEIENGLHHALERNELVLHYQPQVDIGSGKIFAVEALLRWAHPEKGLIPPGKFIPVAEESNLIVAIGEWVLRTACKQNKAWQDAGLPHVRMAVNLSARQFRQHGLVAVVAEAMEDAGLALHSDNLELEVTESMIMKNIGETITTLNKLHEMGVSLSVDDFGTGHSSLTYLKRFPIHTLKIDKSFVDDITSDPDSAAIAATIIALGHSLKLNVIAEGVETAEQLAFLREMKCDEMQGYYFSRPIPAEELERLLREERRLS